MEGSPWDVMVNVQDYDIIVSLDCSFTIPFTFWLIPWGKAWHPLSPLLWVKLHHFCFSTRMVFGIKLPTKADMLLNKETKQRWHVFLWILEILGNHIVGPVGRVIANGQGDLGSIPGCVIPKTLKMVLDTSLLNNQQYKVHIKGKEEQSRERSSAPTHTYTSHYCSYWNGSLLVTLKYGRQLYFTFTLFIYGLA